MFDSSQIPLVDTLGGFVGILLFYLGIGLPLVFGVLYAFYFLLTLPMRRNERARIFLDLLELGLQSGRTAEGAIVEAAASRDPGLSVRFHLLAAHLRNGERLSVALEKVPRLLPAQIRAMLKTGERIGDLQKVLPACRQQLRDGVSQDRGAHNYLVLLAFCITPASLVVPMLIAVRVLPAFRMISEGMGSIQLPAFTELVFNSGRIFLGLQFAFLLLLWTLMILYVGGPRLHGWIGRWLPNVPDRVAFLLPWRRKRLQRDFSTMLAALLDASVPEAEAVKLAAESTANLAMIRRGEKVSALLAQGVKLTVAIRQMDDSGELRWRISNALQSSGGFLRALAGWHEALDARAFQLEQATAQVATTTLVLVNGLVVAAIVIAIFLMLINLLNQAVLW